MKKVYNLFKAFIPIIIALSAVALVFGLLTTVYYYDSGKVSINFKNVIPILTAIMIAVALTISVVFATKVKDIHLRRIKKSFGFTKFAAALASALAAALFFFDFFRFVQMPTTSSPLRILRLLIFVPFIAYLILGLIPRKFKRKKIVLPKWIKPIVSVAALLWSILGLLMIYFWNGLPITNLFKVIYMFYYLLLTFFFLFEIKFELFTPSSRGYVLSGILLFVYTFVLVGSMMLSKFLGFLSGLDISEFELFLAFALGIYALSKVIAIQQTMKFVMDKNGQRSHHHRHHHHHRSSSEAGAAKDADAGATTETATSSETNE